VSCHHWAALPGDQPVPRDSPQRGWLSDVDLFWSAQDSSAQDSGDEAVWEHPSRHLAALAELPADWQFWWAGTGSTAQLIGLRVHSGGTDCLYVSSEEDASLTRTRPNGEFYLHETGHPLSTVVAYLLNDPGAHVEQGQ
jgi:hypothetical protein